MKTVLIILAGLILAGGGVMLFTMRGALATGVQHPTNNTTATLWAQKTHLLDGKETDFKPWQGQVCLVVNVASKCGLTPQYEGLEALYNEFKAAGFVVLAVPSNDFMGQEPGTPAEIRSFCEINFQVSFPLFAKAVVKGDNQSDLYQFLTAGGLEEPSWNFTKYLVDRSGKVVARFAPRTKPDDEDLRQAIAEALQD